MSGPCEEVEQGFDLRALFARTVSEQFCCFVP
jgi:hypothetical protein